VKPGRVAAIAGRILRQFRHDPRTLGLIVVVPLVVMALIGYLMGDSGKERLPVGVVQSGGGVLLGFGGGSPDAAALLARQPGIRVVRMGSAAAAEAAVRDGEVAGAVVLKPPTTSSGLTVEVMVSGTDPGVQGPVVGAVASVVRSIASANGETGVGISVRPLAGSASLSTIDAYAPVLEVVFAFFFTFLLTSVAFLRERSSGTLDRLMASPATRLEVLLGYLLGFVGFALLQSLLILAYAVWVLNVSIAGPVWVVLLVIVLLVVGSVNLGIALSFYARNELQVVQFIPLVLLPQTFLGGLFWPVQTLWAPLRWLSQAFPLTHAAVALREVFIAGFGFADVAGRLLALLAFAVAMVALGVMALRKQRA
jgi:ABC-2 type transport system permease protein